MQDASKPVRRPNILLLTSDQHRGDWLRLYGKLPLRTPNLDALARRGLNFTNARTPSPICAPARACFAAGVDYDRGPVADNGGALPLTTDTIYKRLREGGYEVRSVGKLDLLKPRMSWGVDGQHMVDGRSQYAEMGFTGGRDSAGKHDGVKAYRDGRGEPYFAALRAAGWAETHAEDYEARSPASTGMSADEALARNAPPPPSFGNTAISPLPEALYCDNWVGSSGLDQLEKLCRQDKPWFLVVNFSGPHEPLDVTKAMRQDWTEVDFAGPIGNADADLRHHRHMRQNYAAMIERIDALCGQFLKALRKSDHDENTLVAYSSDHGEMLGDFNLWGKAVPHEASVHIPMIVAGAGVEAPGREDQSVVSWIDLAATCLDVAGLDVPDHFDGISLKSCLENRGSRRQHVLCGLGQWRSIYDGRFKLVAGFRNDAKPREIQFGSFDPETIETAALYDIKADRHDLRDLAELYPEKARELRTLLRSAYQRARNVGVAAGL